MGSPRTSFCFILFVLIYFLTYFLFVCVIIIIITKNVHFGNTEYGKTTDEYFDAVDTKRLSTEENQATLLGFFLFSLCGY
jgi:hypothetical protein